MNNIAHNALNLDFNDLKVEKLKAFFITHLNRIYCAKTNLTKRLPKLAEYAEFKDLRHGILETLEDVQRQLSRMDKIYLLLDAEYVEKDCESVIARADDAYNELIKEINTGLCDLAILFYLSNMESVEMCSFQVLQMAAVKLDNKQIKQLLKENFDEAKDDRVLMFLITANFLSTQ